MEYYVAVIYNNIKYIYSICILGSILSILNIINYLIFKIV